ncbi:MAG: hypothetical protein IK126_05875 [Bacteroidales bacterium]|nr:hypothetical protein [Bacteroidales bacterium]
MKEMKQYTVPVVKVVAFLIEQGFQGTLRDLRLSQNDEFEDYNNQNQENWSEDNTLFGGSGWDAGW